MNMKNKMIYTRFIIYLYKADVKMTLCMLPYLSFHRIIPSPIQQLFKPLMCCTLETDTWKRVKYRLWRCVKKWRWSIDAQHQRFLHKFFIPRQFCNIMSARYFHSSYCLYRHIYCRTLMYRIWQISIQHQRSECKYSNT